MKKLPIFSALSVCFLAFHGHATATTIFSDNFQANNLAANWSGNQYPCSAGTSASIVADPLNPGQFAVGFAKGNCASDIVTTNMFSSPTGIFKVEFDYLHVGTGTATGTGGGFLGWGSGSYIQQWLEMDSPAYGMSQPSNQWTHISATFTSAVPISIAIEQWAGQSEKGYTALYKNFVLADGDGPSLARDVPEPSSIALTSLALLGLVAASRRKKPA
jgi:hypothetical protein